MCLWIVMDRNCIRGSMPTNAKPDPSVAHLHHLDSTAGETDWHGRRRAVVEGRSVSVDAQARSTGNGRNRQVIGHMDLNRAR